MPGREHRTTRARVAEPATPESPPPPPAAEADAAPAGPASLGRPAVTGLVCLLAALAFVLARWQTWAHGNIGRFILVGRRFSIPAQVPRGVPVMPAYGYDGQFFYRLALNPVNFSHTAYGITVDRSYRYMRIGYPVVTWLVSLGQHAFVPVMLVAVNVAAVALLGYLGGVFALAAGRHALAGLLLPAYYGLATSLSRDTAEPLAAVLLLGGLLAVRSRRPVLAAALLTFAALTRETVMVAVAAISIVRVVAVVRRRQSPRPGRDDLVWAIPAVVFVAWQFVVKAVTGAIPLFADSGRNAGTPFLAPFQAVAANLHHISTSQFDQYDLWLLELAILILFSLAALISMRSTNAPGHERLAFVLYLVEICVVTPDTWGSLDADLRSFIEVYLLAVIIVLGTPVRSVAARALPWISALLIPALVAVAERRFTGS